MPIPQSWFRIDEDEDTDWRPDWDDTSSTQKTPLINRPQIPEQLDIAQAWVQWNLQFLRESVKHGL
jgi:hypothetical protein